MGYFKVLDWSLNKILWVNRNICFLFYSVFYYNISNSKEIIGLDN